MKRLLQIMLSIGIIAFLSGCTRELEIVDFKSGATLRGEYDDLEQTARVVMPNGEVLSGRVSQIRESTNSFTNNIGTGKDKKKDSFSTTTTTSNVSTAQGLLRSNSSNLLMDLTLTLNGFGGYGTAKTNDGKEYKVQIRD